MPRCRHATVYRRLWLLTLGMLLSYVTSGYAGPLAFGTFAEFAFSDVGLPATGCDPADPLGGFCIPSSGTPTILLDVPPWTFVAPATGVVLTITDAFMAGDQFQVLDFGTPLGLTSAPVGMSDCGDDPVPCLMDAAISKGVFVLAVGPHAITITPTLSPGGGGSGYLRADVDTQTPIPEPETWVLMLSGVLALGWWRKKKALVALVLLLLPLAAAQAQTVRFAGPTSSQPLALSADGAFLVVANPDNHSVTFFDVRNDRHRRLAEVPVQREPNGVAWTPDGKKVYAANTVSGTVSVMRVNIPNGLIARPFRHIVVGTEPYGLAMTPNGQQLYVTNARSNTVSVIDTATDAVVKTIPVDFEPRGLAMTNDGDADDADEMVYVTHFLSLPVPGKLDGRDDSKQALVTVIATASQTVVGPPVLLNPLPDTGFKALGDAINRIPPGDPTNPADFKFTTGAYPNQLHNVGIRGGFVYVPNTGASPNGPVRFDVNTHSLLSVINRSTQSEVFPTLNMHVAVRDQTNPVKRFITQPWAIACQHNADICYVLSAASNLVVRVDVNPTTGVPAVHNDPTDPTRVLQLSTGKNPRGIVVNASDTRAYVMNYVSRDVTVLDLTSTPERVLAALLSATALPQPGTPADLVHIGKELYHTSIGEFDPPAGSVTPVVGRMSASGWGSCAACHPNGLSDNVVWIFASGPRRTIPQHTDFDLTDPQRQMQRALNWSAIFDEEHDFELNIRLVSGGLGLLVQADGLTPVPTAQVSAFDPANGPPNSPHQQLRVRGVPAWDALKAYVQFGIRPPISPVAKTDPDVITGGALFRAANCQACHGGPQWTSSKVRFTPPPAAAQVVNGQLINELRKVGTFDPTALNEVRANAAPPLGADGFAPASLLSLFAFPETFLHNGAATSLDQVLNNVLHRSAGTGGVDTLSNPTDRARIVKFLLSIDAATPPIP